MVHAEKSVPLSRSTREPSAQPAEAALPALQGRSECSFTVREPRFLAPSRLAIIQSIGLSRVSLGRAGGGGSKCVDNADPVARHYPMVIMDYAWDEGGLTRTALLRGKVRSAAR